MEKNKNNFWIWQIGLGYVVLILLLSGTNLGTAIANSGQWFWMSFAAMILNSVYVISFQFFCGPKYKMEPSIQHACFVIGSGVGMFFIGTTLGMVPFKAYTNFLPMIIVAVMGLVLTGATSNLMVSMAVRAKGISPSLPFVVSNSSNFLLYILASVLGIALPSYFKQASWNLWSAVSLIAFIIGLVVLGIYGLPKSKKAVAVDTPKIEKISGRGRLKLWLLEGGWFSKSFLGMLIITIYLTSFQFFGQVFHLDPVVQQSVYIFFMGLGIFIYSKIIGLFPKEEYKKYVPMAIVFLTGLTIGGWLTNLIMIALRTPNLNPGLPFIVANSFVIITYIVGHWLAIRFNQFEKTTFNWQTIAAITTILGSLLLIKIFA
ncbi:MAG: hypothetical protein Q7K28_02770 [Candidatus Wildermuthbacteria bacterium]|nr:hypothetical protein [Candidatus Wildermuthbacteria bacterium]